VFAVSDHLEVTGCRFRENDEPWGDLLSSESHSHQGRIQHCKAERRRYLDEEKRAGALGNIERSDLGKLISQGCNVAVE
jgi:hypothetical protein